MNFPRLVKSTSILSTVMNRHKNKLGDIEKYEFNVWIHPSSILHIFIYIYIIY